MNRKMLAGSMVALMAVSMIPAAAFAEEEKPTITIMAPEFNTGHSLQNENSDKVIEAYENYTGYHVEYRWADNGAYAELLGTQLMDFENMPMILTATGALSGTVIDAAEQGAFWDLTPFLEDTERFPNLSQTSPTTLRGLTVGGELIALPRTRELGRNGLSYRKDWAEKVGITEDPQTVNDVYDMLYKFTYEDPDGNGKEDTYGMEMTKYTGPFDVIQTWFGCGNGWVDQDGQLIPVHMTPEYKEAIDWIKKVYDDGLMRPDWVTVDTSEWSNGCKKGENGVFIDVMDSGRRIWDYFVNNEVMSVVNPEEYASMRLLGPINNKTLATSGYNGYYLITKDGAKTEEDVINCLTFLDKMNDREMLMLADYGLEGITYDLTEDGYVDRTNYTFEDGTAPHYGLNQLLTYTPGWGTETPLQQNERDLALTECYEQRTRPVAISNPALAYLATAPTYAKSGSDLDKILTEARTQYICGTIDEAGLQAAWDDWFDRGGEDIIAEVNEQYQADQGNAEAVTEEATTEAAE